MFEAFNENGGLQFSTEFCAYYLDSTGSMTLSHDLWSDFLGHYNSPGQGPFPYVWDCPLSACPTRIDGDVFAFRSTSAAAIGQYSAEVYFDQNNQIQSRLVFNAMSATQNTVVTWYKFKPYTSLAPSSGAGLELYNSAGQVTYSSSKKPMRVISQHAITSMSIGMNTYVSLPAGGDYAFVVTNSAIKQEFAVSGSSPQYSPGAEFQPGYYSPKVNGAISTVRYDVSGSTRGFYINAMSGGVYTMGDKLDGSVQVIDVSGGLTP